MAGMCSDITAETFRVLDPGAGVGMLSAAVCQHLLRGLSRRNLYFELWENDARLIPLLYQTMNCCQSALHLAGHEMQFAIKTDDFILANARPLSSECIPERTFDLAILNPPWFKIRKQSPQSLAMQHVVHGQPNIYALFMAAAAELLAAHGEMIAITPRSYFNGPYFRRFRQWFFARMTARQIHVFDSRTEAFQHDAVLQENVILHAVRDGERGNVLLTNSSGRDVNNIADYSAAYQQVIDSSSCDHVVRVTGNRFESQIVSLMDGLPCRFPDHGFRISTGPVVTFRSTSFLRQSQSRDTAPLLWMHNVRPFVTQFPPQKQKPTHIEVSASSRKLLVPAKTYVLLKRFTSKEENRRLVAGIMTAADSYADWVGLENHLNYVCREGADLAESEAWGLAAFFNSALVDQYFRVISGNTQVNAAEIRRMPVPEVETLSRIGDQIMQLELRSPQEVEHIVGQALQIPAQLIRQLTDAG